MENRNWLIVGLILTILFHYFVFICFIATIITCLHIFVWYAGIAIAGLLIRVGNDRTECPITTLENKFRMALGLDTIKVFMKYYVLKPRETWHKLIRDLKRDSDGKLIK